MIISVYIIFKVIVGAKTGGTYRCQIPWHQPTTDADRMKFNKTNLRWFFCWIQTNLSILE
uniref:Uncharacterized protein n=1 Tax=Romanomermis culicivorax TaxID=13658 RepID=A0A915IPY1_ROMCU